MSHDASAMLQAARAPAPAAVPPESTNALLSEPMLVRLLRLTLPNLVAMLVTALVAICETAYVGILGTTELAAIALVLPMVMLMQMLSAGAMGGGVSSAISRALGAGEEARAEALARHALAIGAIAGLCFSATFVAFGPALLRALGGRGPVLSQALAYANIALSGAVLTWLLNTLASIIRGTGNMRVPSLALLAASGLQIVLGGGLGLGIGAVSTPRSCRSGCRSHRGIGQLHALSAALSALRARATLKLRGVPLQREMFFGILKVGAVSAAGPLQVVLTVLILTRLVAGFGTAALAGYGIGARLEFLLVPIVFAIGIAGVPMVGMAIGAGNVARARRVAWTTAGVAILVLGTIGLAVTVAPELWSGLFTGDPAVRAAADVYLRWAGPGFAFVGRRLASTSPPRARQKFFPPCSRARCGWR